MTWLIETVMGVTDMQLMVDSASAEALEHGVRPVIDKGGKVPFINSISGEQARIDAALPLVEKYKCPVIALCLSEEGIPPTAEDRFAVAQQMLRPVHRRRPAGRGRLDRPARPVRLRRPGAPQSPWRRSSWSRTACRRAPPAASAT